MNRTTFPTHSAGVRFLPFLLTTLFLIAAGASAEELTDRSQLSAGNTLIDFDDQTLGVVSGQPLTIGEAAFSSVDDTHAEVGDLNIYEPSTGGYSPPADLVSGKVLRSNTGELFDLNYRNIRIVFANPVAEVGFSWWDATSGENLIEVYNAADQLLDSAQFPNTAMGGNTASFAGIRWAGNEIAYAIAKISASNDVGGIDKVSFGYAPPVVEGTGKDIAYVADNEIWLMDADGSEKHSLGLDTGEFIAYDVALSPDAAWLVFSGTCFSGDVFPVGSNGLWLMKAEAYGPANYPEYIGTNGATFSRASWHPDGRHVAYIGLDFTGSMQVHLVEALDENGEIAGSAPEALTSGAAGNSFADCAFHPDGQYLMASQLGHDLVMFQVFDAAGVRTGSLVVNPLPPITLFSQGYATWPSFSPDGKKVVFAHYKDLPSPAFAIAVLTIRDEAGNTLVENVSTNPRVLHTPGSPDYLAGPSWSPDGSKIVFHDSTGYYRLFTLNANEPENGSTNPRVEVAGVNGVETKFPSFAHPAAPAPVPAPVPPKLVSWWPGENAAWDVVGLRQGSMKNSPNEDPYDVGKVGRAFWFDGIDDYVEGSAGSGSLVQDLTIEVWVQPLDDTGEAMIVSKKSNQSDTVSYSLFLRDGRPVFRSVKDGVASELAATGDPLPILEWTHLAYTEEDEVGRKMYVNGTLVASLPTVTTRYSTNGPLTIGAFVDDAHPTATPGSPFDGLVDELSLYNRALSPIEINLIYIADESGKSRHDPARDFSATVNPSAGWRYGWIDGSGNPDTSNLTGGNPDLGGLFPPPAVLDDSTYLYGNEFGAHLRFNPSKTDRVSFARDGGSTLINFAPRQFAFHPAIGGDLDYAVLQWVAPESGKYALSGTFTGVEDSPTSTDVHLYHGENALFIPDLTADPPETNMIDSFLGDGISTTEEVDLTAGETVSWIVGVGTGLGLDYTGLVASAVLVEPFSEFEVPTIEEFGFAPPLMTGKTVTFRARNEGRPANPSMTAKIQYSPTPTDPESWLYLPGGTMNPSGGLSYILTLNNLPTGNFAFRVATTVDGVGTTFSAATLKYDILAAAPHYEVELDVTSASDPTGFTTHRGDTIDYNVRFRNSGGLAVPPADGVKVLARIPSGTFVTTTGSTPGYEVVRSGADSFAMWTLIRNLNPIEAELPFTIANASTDVLFSSNHGLENGDLITVESSDTLPQGLAEETVYKVASSSSNSFQLTPSNSTTVINILDSGTGTHTLKRDELWQSRTLRVTVADPLIKDEAANPDVALGNELESFGRIVTNASGLGGVAQTPTFETTIDNPLRLTAVPTVDVTPLRSGGTITVDFTVKNEASYVARGTILTVQSPEGLTIIGAPLFVTSSGNPIDPLRDQETQAIVPPYEAGKANPSFEDDADGEQIVIYSIGNLLPGGEQSCRAVFRVQYDWNTVENPNPNPEIFYEQATASVSRPSLSIFTKVPIKTKKPTKKPGKKPKPVKKKFKVVSTVYGRNGFERDLENPFDLAVAAAPLGTPMPRLEITQVVQQGFGPLPEFPASLSGLPDAIKKLLVIEMVANSATPVPNSGTPARTRDQLLYQITFKNTGTRPAENIRLKVTIPADSTYVAGSARITVPDGGPEISPVPIVDGFHRTFTVPFLDPGKANTLKFKVALISGTPVGTILVQNGGEISSRDLRTTWPYFTILAAQVVSAEQMVYEGSDLTEVTRNVAGEITELEMEQRVFYQNVGGLSATGVGINYYIPPGLKFKDAFFVDLFQNRLERAVTKPTVGATSGTVTFPIGTVTSGTSGEIQVVLEPNEPTLPVRTLFGLQTEAPAEAYDDSTAPPTGPMQSEAPAEGNDDSTALPPEESESQKPSSRITFATDFVKTIQSKPFCLIEGPAVTEIAEEVTYQITVGNSGNAPVGIGFLSIPIHAEMLYLSAQGVGAHMGNVGPMLYLSAGSVFNDDNHTYTAEQLENDNGCVVFPISVGEGGAAVVKVTMRTGGTPGTARDVRPTVHLDGRSRRIGTFKTYVVDENDPPSVRKAKIHSCFFGPYAAASLGTADNPNLNFVDSYNLVGPGSRAVAVAGADYFQTTHGVVLVPNGPNIVAAGGGNLVGQDGASLVGQDGASVVSNDGAGFVIAGTSNEINLDVPNVAAHLGGRRTADFVMQNLPRIVAGGGGNIVENGGLNLVRHFIGENGAGFIKIASLVGQDGASLATIQQLSSGVMRLTLAAGDIIDLNSPDTVLGRLGALVGQDAAGLVGQDGAGIVAGGGGNIFFLNKTNFFPPSTIVAAGGGNIVAAGGGNIVAAGGGNIVAAGGGNFILGEIGIVEGVGDN